MSAFKAKRPSSARRNIKQETFSPFVSLSRLRNIQSLLDLPEDGGRNQTRPDSILCVLGIDGRYNDGTRELINYLLFGFFDARKYELERSGFAEEVIDDMIFFIRKQSVDIYCNPVNYYYLMPYVAHWRNLHIHRLDDEQYENEEIAEEFKIKSFIGMVDGSRIIGVPYCSNGQQMEFDKMSIEKWPIIQAYAIEGVGGGTFFTMKYKVQDISRDVQKVLQFVDPVGLELLVTQQLPLFERQWNNMLTVCDLQRSEEHVKLTEGQVCEPLSTYFSHGRVVTAKGGRSLPIRHPFVLFGTHTGRRHLEDAHRAGISFNSDPDSTGLQGEPAHHMICQAVSPRGPLCCTRTYFFDNSVSPLPMDQSDVSKQNPLIKMTDARLLQEIYIAVVKAVLQAINVYSMTSSISKAEEFARLTLQTECRKAEVPVNPEVFKSKRYVEFHLSGYDNQNRPVNLVEGQCCSFIKTLGVTAYDIPSVQHAGEILGSVSFAESFLDSSINVLYPDGSRELNGDCTVLTSNISRYITWLCPDQSIEHHLETDHHTNFGKQLIKCKTANLVVDGPVNDLIIRSGDLYIYEQGVVFIHKHLGVVVLPRQELTAIHFYDGDSPSTVAMLILSYKEHVQYYLASHLKTANFRLVITLQPKTEAYKAFFSTVLPAWRQADQRPTLEMLAELPKELLHIQRHLQDEYQQQALMPYGEISLKEAKCRLPDLHGFLRHFVVSSVDKSPVCSKHLAAVLEEPYDEGSFCDSDEMVVTVIGGVPGSHKQTLCTSLTELAKDDSRWVVIRQPVDRVHTFSAHDIQTSIATTWRNRRQNKGISDKRMRAILVTSGFTDVVDVIQAIVSQPDMEVARHVKIGSVTVCIDPANAFMQNFYTLPKLLDNCAQGWVNCVLFCGSAVQQQNPQLDNLQRLIRAANSDVALLLASSRDVTRSPDLDLILSETAFNQQSLIRARYLSCPGWWLGQFDSGAIIPQMTELAIQFRRPLEKRNLFTKLRSLRASHIGMPFTGNVYEVRGRIQLRDSDQVFELQHVVLSGAFSLNPVSSQPSPSTSLTNGLSSQTSSIVFTGCQLEESVMKDWLRGCARQKPEKKARKSVKTLTRAEINRIHKLHHLDPLPEGWFYNGTQFISLSGDRSDTHPDLDKFIENYVNKLNSEIDEYNNSIDREEYYDLFE